MPPDYPQQPPQPPAQQPWPPQPNPQPGYPPQQPDLHPAPYDFIINPAAPAKAASFKLPGTNNSKLMRVVMLAGGLLILIILISIIKSLIFKGPDFTGYIGVAQDQQELIHLFTSSAATQTLSASDQNLAATAEVSLTSNQTRLITYLSNNHQKINAKTLDLKLSSSLDTQLANAQTADTYQTTYQSIIQSELSDYLSDLTKTYNSTKGVKGRTLLKTFYAQGSLLLEQSKVPTD
jgi:hypothetical protein